MLIEYLADRPDLLRELAAVHFAEWGRFRPGQTIDDRIESLKRCSGKRSIPSAVIATDGRELIGSAMLVAHDMTTRKDLHPWLAGVYVKPSCRKAGVATRLVQRVENEAVELHVAELYLYTDKQSRFYAKRGWHTMEATEYKGIQVMIMAKELVAQHSAPADRKTAARFYGG